MTSNGILDKHALGLSFNKADANNSGLCVLCGKKSESKCDRCGDYYCSEICQRKDWPNHRFICFPIPRLVKVGQCSAPKTEIAENEALLEKVATSTKNSNVLPNGSCVLLTAFKSSNRCYIRSTNPSTVSEYEKVLNEINEYGKKSSALTEKPKLNSYALSFRGGKWCRVQVLANHKDIKILFVDFGNTSRRCYKELRKIDPSLVNLPCHVHMVQLKGVTNYSTQQNLLNSLTQYTSKEYKVEFDKSDKSDANVELFFWGTSKLLNSIIQDLSTKYKDNDTDCQSVGSSSPNAGLVKNGNSVKNESEIKSKQVINNKSNNEKQQSSQPKLKDGPPKNSNDVKTTSEISVTNKVETKDGNELGVANHIENKNKIARIPRQIQTACLEPPFEIIPINEDEKNFKVIIVDNSYIESGYIGCLLEKYRENLLAITKFLSDHNVGDQPYKPKLNEYCLANYEGEWYRAKVVEILSEDIFLVVYIDFTNESELTSKSIRRYPMSLNLPCCTTLCAIDGLPYIKDEIKKFLELNAAAFSELNIDSVRKEEDIIHVKSNELLNKMRDLKIL